jgi:UDP-N-acetylglucosamine--N-acetylmuramyl-(pentapeptide) pyrophosphoryl-undecaprenol N-acetylglucosamine transferase
VHKYRVVHITGKGKGGSFSHANYRSFEFLSKELADVIAMADLIVSRAGANAIFEFLALRKPMLLIPLEVGSRGDQVDNAKSFVSRGYAHVLLESQMTPESLIQAIEILAKDKHAILESQNLHAQLIR